MLPFSGAPWGALSSGCVLNSSVRVIKFGMFLGISMMTQVCDYVLGECRWSLSLGNHDRGPPHPGLLHGKRALFSVVPVPCPSRRDREGEILVWLRCISMPRCFYDVVSFCGSLPRQTEEYFLPRMIQEVTEQVSLGEQNTVFSHVPPSKAGGGPRGQEPWCQSHRTLVAHGSDRPSEGVLPECGGGLESPERCSGPLSSGLAGGVPWGARRVSPATPPPTRLLPAGAGASGSPGEPRSQAWAFLVINSRRTLRGCLCLL